MNVDIDIEINVGVYIDTDAAIAIDIGTDIHANIDIEIDIKSKLNVWSSKISKVSANINLANSWHPCFQTLFRDSMDAGHGNVEVPCLLEHLV